MRIEEIQYTLPADMRCIYFLCNRLHNRFIKWIVKEKNIKLSIASSNYENVIVHNLDVLKIKDYFDFYLSYKDVESGNIKAKPAPDIYLLAAKKMQLPKENLLVFEDSSTGVAAASAAGLKCVMVPDLKQPTNLDKDKATLICKDFYAFLEKIK